MVSLSVERINAVAPYKVTTARGENSVKFDTEYGVQYVVGFDSSDFLLCAETYQFFIANGNNKRSPRDEKLKATIVAIAWDFLMSSNEAMVYICDTGDGKQAMRNRLFKYWITESPLYNKVTTVTTTIKDEEDIDNYATLVIRNDHPKKNEILGEFVAATDFLNNKPN